MNLKKRITTAIATGAVVLNALAPAAFASETTVSGNGAFSDNTVDVSNSSNTSVNQSNNANVSNHVDSNASTGGNDASFNTGGDTTINTGNASTNTTVHNDLNSNAANVESSGGNGGSDVTISGNGAFSDNDVNADSRSNVRVNQDNNANVSNHIDSNAKTGGNDAKFNTGGDTNINTGNASTDTFVSTEANRNVANVSGGNGSGGSSVKISGNGAFSDNKARVSDRSSTIVDQDNDAWVFNRVNSDAKTGENDAGFNTGGDVNINTGDARARTDVRNAVNFNAADVENGNFSDDVTVKISGNGAESRNKVHADSSDTVKVFQDNDADLFNKVDNNAKTGHNSSKFNTGDGKHFKDKDGKGGETSISTGHADTGTTVHNSGNTNVSGEGAHLKFPGDLGVNFDFDLSGLFNAFSFQK